MGRPYSHLPVEHWRGRRLPQLGPTHKTPDECWGKDHAKISSSPAGSVQLASSTSRDQVDSMQSDPKALGNIRIPINTRGQDGKMRNRIQKQLKRDRTTAYCGRAMRNGFSAVEWNHQTTTTLGLIIVPEPQLNFEECTKALANGLAAMEYAIQRAAMRLAEESPTDVAGQEASHELELRSRLFDFVRSHVVYSSSSSWGSARIQGLIDDFLLYLRSSKDFPNRREFRRKTERQLALLFDSALQFRARLVHSGGYRYELVQFKPDDISDPGLLKVQGTEGTERTRVSSTDGSVR